MELARIIFVSVNFRVPRLLVSCRTLLAPYSSLRVMRLAMMPAPWLAVGLAFIAFVRAKLRLQRLELQHRDRARELLFATADVVGHIAFVRVNVRLRRGVPRGVQSTLGAWCLCENQISGRGKDVKIKQTLRGSFSAVSKPNFASKYSLESS